MRSSDGDVRDEGGGKEVMVSNIDRYCPSQ